MADVDVLAIGGNEVPWHRFEEKGPVLESILEADEMDVERTTARSVLLPDRIRRYDVVVDYRTQNGSREAELEGLLQFVREGGGYVPLHGASLITDRVGQGFRELVGGAFVEHTEPADLDIEIVGDHPVVEGVDRFAVHDEPYKLEVDDVTVLAAFDHAPIGGRMPALWTHTYGDGRVVYCSLGHFTDVYRDINVQRILRNAVRWTAAT